MPHVDSATLDDWSLFYDGLGGLIAIIALARLLSGQRWRNPLSQLTLTGRAPPGPAIPGVVFAYGVLAAAMAAGIPLGEAQRKQLDQPGSGPWHAVYTTDLIAKLVVSAAMLWLMSGSPLVSMRTLRGPGKALRWLKNFFAGLATGAGATLVCNLQLAFVVIAWLLIRPSAEPPTHVVLESFGQSEWGSWGRAELFVGALVVAPLAEELFFRGLLLGWLTAITRRPWLSILLSAFAFALIHLPQFQDLLPLTTFAVLLGYLRLRSGSLTACVVAHAIFNARAMLMLLFSQS